MDICCVHCNALHFKCETISNKGNSFYDCCGHGEVKLDKLPQPPPELFDLLNGKHPKSKEFIANIRKYNCSISFASMKANLMQFHNRPGPFCYVVQGHIYYHINTSVYPQKSDSPSFGQLFIVDQNEATKHRINFNADLDPEILNLLDSLMRKHNIFAQSYEMMGKELEEQKKNNNCADLHLLFGLKPETNKHRYNFQKCNEVAAVFATKSDGDIPDSYVVIRNKNTKKLQEVKAMDPNVEPRIYPVFYPYGTQGHDAASIQLCNQNNTNNKNENTINNDDSTDNNDNNDNNDDNTDKNDEKVINHNEINDYINSRYVGPSEAYWRIMSKKLKALGLIEDDNEWHIAMNEAVHWMMPNSLRKLFVLILIHCNPIHPERLWDTFKQSLSEDYTKKYGQTEGIKKAYLCINNILQKEGCGILNDKNNEINIPSICVIKPGLDLPTIIYGDLLLQKKYKIAAKCAILAARNKDVNEINTNVLHMLDEDTEMIYTSIDSADNCDNGDSLSRVKSWNSIKLQLNEDTKIDNDTYKVKNIVYNEMFI
ncbi:hypothetical protein TKK_0015339 [Trichogramma kaykai]